MRDLKSRLRLGLAVAVMMCSLAASAQGSSPTRRVIVVLRKQAAGRLFRPGLAARRERSFTVAQRSVMSQMSTSGARGLHAYRLIDALSATVTAAEEVRLRTDPAVAEVVPDQVIRLPGFRPSGRGTRSAVASSQPVCAPDGRVELDPEALENIGADSDQPGARTARSLGLTGAGVKVAFIADGLDINDPDLVRRDGKRVIIDYKDFTGEGTGAPTGGAEAFLDASALSAQGRKVYDVSHYSALPLRQPCRIRIEGVAPGAGLVELDVLGSDDAGFTSSLLQGIDYAVTVDHVQVINESLADNPYPDDGPAFDVVKRANDNAVAAGVTVVAGSQDAGPTNTEGTPASDSRVIAAGASTTYRSLIQTGSPARFPGLTGWLDDNISSFSSSGFTFTGRTIDLVAPGEDNWALCSTDVAMYASCYDEAGRPDAVSLEGGTSQAAPLTAGVAALVIEAYRRTHRGVSPSPSLVKQLIVGSADDIGAPADLQGSGRLDAYRAVLAAEAYRNRGKARPGQGGPLGLIETATQLNSSGPAGRAQALTDTITNPGPAADSVSLSTRSLGPYHQIRSTSVELEDSSSSHIPDAYGFDENYARLPFNVPAGQNRLRAAAAFLSATAISLTYPVDVTLVDPDGRLASYSDPQGEGNYGVAEVTDPIPGRWTAYISAPLGAESGTTGPVRVGVSSARYTSFGQVRPSRLKIPAGASRTVSLRMSTPTQPGDAAGALVLDFRRDGDRTTSRSTVPVTLRALIPTGPHVFTATLTGGNGRNVPTGQTFYYQMSVPAGLPELNADIRLGDNPHNPFNAFWISPSGEALSAATNDLPTTSAPGYRDDIGAQLHVLAPAAGKWTLVIVFAPQVSGTALAEPVRIATSQSSVPVTTGLPQSARDTLLRGVARTFEVKVRNPGTTPEAYFLDARSPATVRLTLRALNSADTNEPLTASQVLPTYLVPTDTTSFTSQARADGSEPIEFNIQPTLGLPSDFSGDGDPNIESTAGLDATANLSDSPVAPGLWTLFPVLAGPFGPAGGSPEPVTTSMSVATRGFDPAVSSPIGDLWEASTDPTALSAFNPVIAQPGTTHDIPVTIKPRAAPGSIVRGTLYVDDASLLAFQINRDLRGGHVVAIPYTYRVK